MFVNEGGLFLPRLENDHSIAALASDGQGRSSTSADRRRDHDGSAGRDANGCGSGVKTDAMGRIDVRQLNAGQTIRNLADFTGGMAAVYTPSEKTLAKIDARRASRYLL